jgi:prostaglandin-endoperoxide synthase 2
MIPDELILGDRRVGFHESLWNPGLVKGIGLGDMFHYASIQPAGEIGVKNTMDGDMLKWTDIPMIQMGRTAKLDTFNRYRELYRLEDHTFETITDDTDVRDALMSLYSNDIHQIEFVTGIYAEKRVSNGALGELMSYMVGIDAFSQILTNPLLSERNWNEYTFGKTGWRMLQEPWSLDRLVKKYAPECKRDDLYVSLTRKDWEWKEPKK